MASSSRSQLHVLLHDAAGFADAPRLVGRGPLGQHHVHGVGQPFLQAEPVFGQRQGVHRRIQRVPAEVPQTLVALSGRQPALPPDDRVIDGYMLEETTDGFYYVSSPEDRGAPSSLLVPVSTRPSLVRLHKGGRPNP